MAAISASERLIPKISQVGTSVSLVFCIDVLLVYAGIVIFRFFIEFAMTLR